mgnify:CR=1 FL=1
MKHLYNLKNKLEDLYFRMPGIISYFTRLIPCLLGFLVLRANLGFNEILTNIFFVIFFAIVCAFLPLKLILLTMSAYIVVQVFSLSAGVGVLACMVFVLVYLLYFRFDEKTGFAMILIPLLCMIRLPLLVPLVLAVIAPIGSVISVMLGFIVYYLLHYLHTNAAVFQGLTDGTEITKMSVALSGFFSYRELWYTMACIAVAFFLVFFLKKINVNKSNQVAIAIGAGVYLIIILLSYLAVESITYQRLVWAVANSVISCILAILASDLILPLDYSRTELLEFEDEEYKYFIRAVPKVSVTRESVRIKRIYSRKQTDPSIRKEESQ